MLSSWLCQWCAFLEACRHARMLRDGRVGRVDRALVSSPAREVMGSDQDNNVFGGYYWDMARTVIALYRDNVIESDIRP